MKHLIKGAVSAGALGALSAFATAGDNRQKPNILWITSEDNNVDWVGCYGNPNGDTPNIDKLASRGFMYTHAFANAPVCAPSRCTWITGIPAISMGTQPMRSRYPIPHDKIKYYPDFLRKAGYFCGNYFKTDYNIGGRNDKECWDSLEKPDWSFLKQHQPFFQVINLGESHESRAQGSVENTKHDPSQVHLRKYHPDIPGIRKNYAKYQDCVRKMDGHLGKILDEFKKSGMLDDTIIIYCSDHGGVLPRSKRYLYDQGIHSPLIIKIPEKFKYLWPADKPGEKIDRLVSYVDMPKTWLSIVGAEIPQYMHGRIFLGPDSEPEAEYHFAFSGRQGERIDNIRTVRDKRFIYIKNYMPYRPWGQYATYLWKMVATRAWSEYFKQGKTNEITAKFFKPKPHVEELYDTLKDPDNVNDLSQDPEYRPILEKMRIALRDWQLRVHDSGLLPEGERARRAAQNNTTIYEMARDPKLYDLEAYLDAADTALAKKPENLSALIAMMGNRDSALRYWGITGCLVLGKEAEPARKTAEKLLDDECDEVADTAALFLHSLGEKEKSIAALRARLDKNSGKYFPQLCYTLNVVDWIGDDGKKLIPEIEKITSSWNNVAIIKKNYLLYKYGVISKKDFYGGKKKKREKNIKQTK
jgi:arylsulfatase A-like enzyme